MTDQLESKILKGRGIFSSNNYRFESYFTVQRQLAHTVILIQHFESTKHLFHLFFNSNLWSLSGQLEDGRPVAADQLMLSRIDSTDENVAEFSPLAGLSFGQSSLSPPVEAQYPLIGLFDGKFSIDEHGWTIEVHGDERVALVAKRRSKAWGIPLEGLKLKLVNILKSSNEYHEKAQEIMLLLSLATGSGVTSYRHIVNWDNQEEIEVWRKMTGDEIGPGPIIPAFKLGEFLKQALPIWREWNSKKKSDARLAIIYINLSATGYLDTRLFQISQAWEFLASSWMPGGVRTNLESDLQKKIKAGYREWKEDNPEADPEGYWGTRITFPFKWPKAKRQIESLVESQRIDLSKIGLDFEALKEVRDSVAHTGKMRNQERPKKKDTYQLLLSAQFCLQLLLLAELGYSGLVFTSNEDQRSEVPIENYFKK